MEVGSKAHDYKQQLAFGKIQDNSGMESQGRAIIPQERGGVEVIETTSNNTVTAIIEPTLSNQ